MKKLLSILLGAFVLTAPTTTTPMVQARAIGKAYLNTSPQARVFVNDTIFYASSIIGFAAAYSLLQEVRKNKKSKTAIVGHSGLIGSSAILCSLSFYLSTHAKLETLKAIAQEVYQERKEQAYDDASKAIASLPSPVKWTASSTAKTALWITSWFHRD
ncbi:MAG TPA: hypothetical protein QGF02_01615 [Candidatus Babeliales bacterium]|nr:hypothetical protein [Candidatus Babeliales bacterium]